MKVCSQWLPGAPPLTLILNAASGWPQSTNWRHGMSGASSCYPFRQPAHCPTLQRNHIQTTNHPIRILLHPYCHIASLGVDHQILVAKWSPAWRRLSLAVVFSGYKCPLISSLQLPPARFWSPRKYNLSLLPLVPLHLSWSNGNRYHDLSFLHVEF